MTLSPLVIIPWRDRGRDPRRPRNLTKVKDWWAQTRYDVHITDDGRGGDEQFNRHAAYNRGAEYARNHGYDTLIYTEADMLVPPHQIHLAVKEAHHHPGLVVPFTTYRHLNEQEAQAVCDGQNPEDYPPDGSPTSGSMGPINILTLHTLDLVGRWDECFDGNWYDDTAMCRAFWITSSPTRHIPGIAWHLHHLPGHPEPVGDNWVWGDHATQEDKNALHRNQQRWYRYEQATTPHQIRALTTEQP